MGVKMLNGCYVFPYGLNTLVGDEFVKEDAHVFAGSKFPALENLLTVLDVSSINWTLFFLQMHFWVILNVMTCDKKRFKTNSRYSQSNL